MKTEPQYDSWVAEWITPVAWTRDQEALDWLRSRPETLRPIMLRFPPSCVVRANRPLRVPEPGTCGIVASWFEPSERYPAGSVSVRQHPDSGLRAQCSPEWLEVVGYWRGLTPEVLAALLAEPSSTPVVIPTQGGSDD